MYPVVWHWIFWTSTFDTPTVEAVGFMTQFIKNGLVNIYAEQK